MDPEHLDHFRERLETQRRELQDNAETAHESTQTVALDQARVGRLSRMDALQGQAMAVEAQRRRTLWLRRIEAALRRIEAGEYGWCTHCEEAILPARLETDPAVTLCIACAERQETR
ncbi:TraR/DksA family transcriptional regulator [Elongatibacter sediminis]|uniref:TraR/DksA family transcriptional regulator n=1 Tax=Elongatibacter sediminis TaxID=3119006 RepID=A0AAW9R592_9GAMM